MQSDPFQPYNPNTSPDNVDALAPYSNGALRLPLVQPWRESVDGKLLLDALARITRNYIVISKRACHALALFIVHTYAFPLWTGFARGRHAAPRSNLRLKTIRHTRSTNPAGQGLGCCGCAGYRRW
jgi:hypothetical protein